MINIYKKIFNFILNVDLIFYIYEKYSKIRGVFSIFLIKIFYPKSFRIGKNFKIWGSFQLLIDGRGKVRIGNNFHAVSSARRSYITLYSNCKLTSIHGGEINIEDNVGINGTVLVSKKLIKIGKNTIIAPNSILIDHDGHDINNLESRIDTKDQGKEIIIGKNCWIGMNSIILKGVIIGENTVIGAGSVVTKNCDKNSIYAGNPAKKIKKI